MTSKVPRTRKIRVKMCGLGGAFQFRGPFLGAKLTATATGRESWPRERADARQRLRTGTTATPSGSPLKKVSVSPSEAQAGLAGEAAAP